MYFTTPDMFADAQETDITSKVKVPTGHQFEASVSERNAKIAEELGVDYSAVGSTYTLSKMRSGGVAVFTPCIRSIKGVACLEWGDTYTPLSDLNRPFTVDNDEDSDDGKLWLVFELESTSLFVPMRLLDVKTKKSELRKSLKDGTFATLLNDFDPDNASKGGKYVKLAEVEPGTYTVVSFYTEDAFGRCQYRLVTDTGLVIKGNSAIANRLAHVRPEAVSKELPAKLTVKPVVETTEAGHPIVPITLELTNSKPKFTF